jgi:predicted glycoside hydrolase/deacetylase ChbG (UPF0249 family)
MNEVRTPGPPLPATSQPPRLVIHADDFGLTPGVNAGIAAAHRAGTVLSASLMTTTPGFDDAIALARQLPTLDLGIHLNLTAGPPCLLPAAIPSLVDRVGRFHQRDRWLVLAARGRLRPAEVAAELAAQVARALATGLPFSHLDSHHHVHLFPPVTAAVADLARHHGLPAVRLSDEQRLLIARPALARLLGVAPASGAWARRWLLALASRRAARVLGAFVHADYFAGLLLTGPGLDAAGLATLVSGLPPGSTELMCHPGYGDAALAALDPVAARREREVALLTNPALRAAIDAAGVRLIRLADLARQPAAPDPRALPAGR